MHNRFRSGILPGMDRRRRLLIRSGHRGSKDTGRGLSVPTYKLKTVGTEWVTPYGHGLALREDAWIELPGGLRLRVKVRDGRPQPVAIESPDSDHPITRESLRFKLETDVQMAIVAHTVRIIRDPKTGKEYGVPAADATGLGETRSIAERTRDVNAAAKFKKRGRPALTDGFLREVVREWGDAKKLHGRRASGELAETYNVEPATIRQWLFKARKRGLGGGDG